MTDLWSTSRRARRFLLVIELLAALSVTLLSFGVTGSSTHASWFGVAATAAVFVAFLLRRRSVRWMIGLALLAGLLQLVEPKAFITFADILYTPICAALGVNRDARVRRIGLACAGLAVVLPSALLVPRLLPESHNVWGVAALFLMFAATTAGVTFGGWVWGYLRLQQRLQVEAVMAAQVSEVERRRLEQAAAQSAFREQIAADMHDVVGHSWAVVAAQADGARYALRTSPETAERALETIADVARSSITELREILRQLRYSEGLDGQLGAEQTSALVARMEQAGMTIELEQIGNPSASQTARLTAHRLLTECLTNALKHGDLTHPVSARLVWDDGFTLDVENTARSTRAPGSGLGIAGMRERAHSLGGTLEVSRRAQAWHVHARIPGAITTDARRADPAELTPTTIPTSPDISPEEPS